MMIRQPALFVTTRAALCYQIVASRSETLSLFLHVNASKSSAVQQSTKRRKTRFCVAARDSAHDISEIQTNARFQPEKDLQVHQTLLWSCLGLRGGLFLPAEQQASIDLPAAHDGLGQWGYYPDYYTCQDGNCFAIY